MPVYSPPRWQLDDVMLALVQGAVLLLFVYGIFMHVLMRYRQGRGGVSLTVTRGDKSMSSLFAIYGIFIVAIALTIQVADAGRHYKVSLVVLDYIMLTYLFFYNGWFRNWLLNVLNTIRRD